LVQVNAAFVALREPNAEWAAFQCEDPFLKAIHAYTSLPRSRRTHRAFYELTDPALTGREAEFVSERAQYRRQRNRFIQHRGLVYRVSPTSDRPDTVHQLLLPRAGRAREQAIRGCHEEAGHQGADRTLDLLAERFWWPGMSAQVTEKVRNCARCIRFKSKCEKAPLKPVWATFPLDLIHVDHLAVELSTGRGTEGKVPVQQLLVVTDHFTRYARVFPVPNLSAKATARVLTREYFLVHGVPARLMSDQGTAFDNKLIKALCEQLDVGYVRASASHPQSNGQVERFNRTLLNMLGTLDLGKKECWTDHLNAVTHAYNSTLCQVTGYSPYYLMYGRKARLPVDIQFPTRLEAEATSPESYVADLRSVMTEATRLATRWSGVEAQRQKRYYDRAARAVTLRPGDEVLLRIPSYRGRRKISDRWEDVPYEVLGQVAPDLPVYRVKSRQTGKIHHIHRNRLFLLTPAPGSLGPRLEVVTQPTDPGSGVQEIVQASQEDRVPQAGPSTA
jgi:transposase InsO family protein